MALRDVSIIPESPGAHGSGLNIALWAISDKGDVTFDLDHSGVDRRKFLKDLLKTFILFITVL